MDKVVLFWPEAAGGSGPEIDGHMASVRRPYQARTEASPFLDWTVDVCSI